jgi:hypothetical protein
MADEKPITADLDDWLDDLDDSAELSGELDQENIDALLGGGPGFGEAATIPAPAAAEENAAAELDQANIDALLNGGLDLDNAAPATGEKAGESAAAADDPLDQDNIDALLRGSLDLDDAAPATGEKAGESAAPDDLLDQDNIDALLGAGTADTDQAPAEPPENSAGAADGVDLVLGGANEQAASPDAEDVELDQDNIDALLRGAGSNDAPPAAPDALPGTGGTAGAGEELDVDQDEIDQLFSGLDDEIDEPFPAETMEPAAPSATKNDFLKVKDMPPPAEDTLSADDATITAAAAVAAAAAGQGQEPGKRFPSFLSGAFMKISAAVLVVCLVLFAGAAFFFFRGEENQEPAIPVPVAVEEPVAQVAEPPPPPPAPANTLPVASDAVYRMAEGGGEVKVALTARDEENDPLTFELTGQPLHGRLSGEAPALVYLPNQDFPGEDRFEYKVGDGKGSSCPASVFIIGPNLAQLAADKEKAAAEKKAARPAPALLARNITYDTTNTAEVTIEWGRVWREANRTPYAAGIAVEIDTAGLRGTLVKVNADRYRYRPDPDFVGKDVISYRFRRDGSRSGPGKLTMRVRDGNLAPEIHMAEMAATYSVGETVRVDASATRDEARTSLTFDWEQVAGVPVQMKRNNAEGSVISFTMPSFFYTEEDPGPVLRVTVTDAAGKSSAREVRVRPVSRRTSPLWGGAAERIPRGGRLL